MEAIRYAVTDYLAEFTDVAPENIIWGNQNNTALPKSNDYIIFNVINTTRHGTTVESWSKDLKDDSYTLEETLEFLVQVDFYASTNNGQSGIQALKRCQDIELISRSTMGVYFFNCRGMSILYADDSRDLTGIGDSDDYVRRAMTTLHLCACYKTVLHSGFFDSVKLRIHNVDTAHQPKEN